MFKSNRKPVATATARCKVQRRIKIVPLNGTHAILDSGKKVK